MKKLMSSMSFPEIGMLKSQLEAGNAVSSSRTHLKCTASSARFRRAKIASVQSCALLQIVMNAVELNLLPK